MVKIHAISNDRRPGAVAAMKGATAVRDENVPLQLRSADFGVAWGGSLHRNQAGKPISHQVSARDVGMILAGALARGPRAPAVNPEKPKRL